jgi:hypothetical protein
MSDLPIWTSRRTRCPTCDIFSDNIIVPTNDEDWRILCANCKVDKTGREEETIMAGPSLKEAIDVAAQATILQHEGKKYLRRIYAPPGAKFGPIGVRTNEVWMEVDVYAVLEAFGVTCPAIGHAIKKLLCAGQRGKGDSKADLIGAIAAINRAIELEQNRQREAERGDTTG